MPVITTNHPHSSILARCATTPCQSSPPIIHTAPSLPGVPPLHASHHHQSSTQLHPCQVCHHSMPVITTNHPHSSILARCATTPCQSSPPIIHTGPSLPGVPPLHASHHHQSSTQVHPCQVCHHSMPVITTNHPHRSI